MLRLFAAAAAALVFSAAPGLAETRTLEIPAFSGIEINSGIKAVVTVGDAQSVVAEAPSADDFKDLRYEVRDGVLRVWYDWNIFRVFDFSDRRMVLAISAPALDEIASTSGANVDVTGIAGDSLRIEATSGAAAAVHGARARSYHIESTSGASLAIDGSCESAQVEATTGASIAATELACTDVKAEATTGANLSITATGRVDVEVTTGANATFHGGPTIDKLETSTGGSVSFPK